MKYSSIVLGIFFMLTAVHAQQRAAGVNYARAVADAKLVIDKGKKAGKFPPMPEPPSYDPPCDEEKRKSGQEKAKQQVDAYYEKVFGEETKAAANVIEADKALKASGGQPTPDFTTVVGELFTYVFFPKVNSLLKQYGGSKSSQEKFFAVVNIVIQVDRQASAMGFEDKGLLAELGAWAKRNIEEDLKKIRNEHDYSLVRDALDQHRYATSASVDAGSLEDLVVKLVNALTFKLKLEGTYETQAGGGGGKVTTEVEIELKPDDKLQGWEGHHSGKYTFGELKTDEGPLNVVLQTFPVVAKLENFDPCKDMVVDVIFDHIGAEQDQLVYQGRAIPSPRPISIVETPGKAMFVIAGNYQPDTGFKFVRQPLHNKQKIVVDETVNQSQNQDGGKASARIHMQLIHSPK